MAEKMVDESAAAWVVSWVAYLVETKAVESVAQ